MLDINFIKKNKDKVNLAIFHKNIDLNIDSLLDLSEKRNSLQSEIDKVREDRNKNIDKFKNLQNRDKFNDTEFIEYGKNIKDKLKVMEEEYRNLDKEFQNMMLTVPNVFSPDTPIGKSDSDNVEVKRWGNIPEFNFEFKNHIELGTDLDILDLDTGVKVSGFRGYYLKNAAVILHFSVLWYVLNKLIQKGFTPFLPPTMVNEFVLTGSGHFPFGKDEIYQLSNQHKIDNNESSNPVYLTGTSEPSLLGYYSDRILKEKDLPLKVCGMSQCYRSEIGSHGKDAKGLYRIHEFMKVEQVIICKADIDESNALLEELRLVSEEILEDLELPYRVLSICTGDMGAGKYKMYDIETWMPSRKSFGETHSDSNLTDWQTRRLNIKYQKENGEKEYAFALNNTAIASPRILIALMENYQQADGSIKIPDVLRPYFGNKEFIQKKDN